MREYLVWLSKVITLVLVVLVGIPMLIAISGTAINAVSGKTDVDTEEQESKKVAVVELTGMIIDSKTVIQRLYKQAYNDKVKAIVLRIDSPGGAVGPSQEIYSAVARLKERKPIVASMGSMAASGGFYAAMGASKILCQPGTLTGSLGVILEIPNFTKIAGKVGFDMITIKSGKLKDAGNSFREMNPEEKQFLQGTVNTVLEGFIQAVVDGRKITRAEVVKFADGRVIPGSEALALKLVDGYGDVYDAAREGLKLAGESLAEDELPKLLYSEKSMNLLMRLIEGFEGVSKLVESHSLVPRLE